MMPWGNPGASDLVEDSVMLMTQEGLWIGDVSRAERSHEGCGEEDEKQLWLFQRLRLEDYGFKTSMGNVVRPCLKIKANIGLEAWFSGGL